jgi:hypothetical protein
MCDVSTDWMSTTQCGLLAGAGWPGACQPASSDPVDCTWVSPESRCIALPTADGGASTDFGLCGVGTCPNSDYGQPYGPCMGSYATLCYSGVLLPVDCGQRGSCELDADAGAGICVGSGAACSMSMCAGENVVQCINGHAWTNSCSVPETAGICQDTGQNPPTCVPSPSLACDPTSFVDSCDGSLIRYCDGTVKETDCHSLGFSACKTFTQQVANVGSTSISKTYAACQ